MVGAPSPAPLPAPFTCTDAGRTGAASVLGITCGIPGRLIKGKRTASPRDMAQAPLHPSRLEESASATPTGATSDARAPLTEQRWS